MEGIEKIAIVNLYKYLWISSLQSKHEQECTALQSKHEQERTVNSQVSNLERKLDVAESTLSIKDSELAMLKKKLEKLRETKEDGQEMTDASRQCRNFRLIHIGRVYK